MNRATRIQEFPETGLSFRGLFLVKADNLYIWYNGMCFQIYECFWRYHIVSHSEGENVVVSKNDLS